MLINTHFLQLIANHNIKQSYTTIKPLNQHNQTLIEANNQLNVQTKTHTMNN